MPVNLFLVSFTIKYINYVLEVSVITLALGSQGRWGAGGEAPSKIKHQLSTGLIMQPRERSVTGKLRCVKPQTPALSLIVDVGKTRFSSFSGNDKVECNDLVSIVI